MAVSITHRFVSAIADSPNPSLVRPTNWNDTHSLPLSAQTLIGNSASISTSAEEIGIDSSLAFTGTTLGVVNLVGKTPTKIATVGANIVLSRIQTIDGVLLVSGDRVLVKDQTNSVDNGIYTVAAGVWSRSSDFDTSAEVINGTQIFVTNGNGNANSIWVVTTANPITLGTSQITWGILTRLTSIPLLKFGVTANGTTSDLAAFNRAVAYANSAGGNVAFQVPVGTTLLNGAPTPITVDGVFFIGDGAPQDCIIKSTNTSGIQWGTGGAQATNGGMLNVGLDGDGGVNDVILVLPNAARMRFDNIFLKNGVAQLTNLGSPAAAVSASQISFTRLRGIVANVAAPLIQALKGAGLWVNDFDVFVDVVFLSQASGRHFVSFSQADWDSAEINNGFVQVFDAVVSCATGTGTIQSISVHHNFFDQNLQGLIFNAAGGTTIYAPEIYDNEITAHGTGGLGVSAIGAGTHFGYRISRNRILSVNRDGISLPASAAMFTIDNNHIYGVNRAVGAFNGITIATGASNGMIANNNVGTNVGAILGSFVTGVPQFGISIGNVSAVLVTGNLANGTSAGFSLGTLTNSKLRGNQGFTNAVADTSGKDTPAYLATEGGTGFSTYTLGDIIYSDATDSLAKLPGNTVATRKYLRQTGTGAASQAPVWDTFVVADIPLTNNHILVGNSSNVAVDVAMSGDASIVASGALTLASVATAGTTGSSTAIPVITINVKGLTTSITTAAVVAPAGTLTGTTLAAGVTASSLTSLGTITSLTATTINAFTLGGTISGGGNQINNIIIGNTTPLAGTFTLVTTTAISLCLSSTASTTGILYHQIGNTGNTGYFGCESTTGGTLVTGSTSYAFVVASTAVTKNLELAANNSVVARIWPSAGVSINVNTDAGAGNLLISGLYKSSVAPTANTSATTTITNGADSSSNCGHRLKVNLNGTDYWIPCGATAF